MELATEVSGDVNSRPLGALVEQANDLMRELVGSTLKRFEVVDPACQKGVKEEAVRVYQTEANGNTAFWPVSDFLSEFKRLQDAFNFATHLPVVEASGLQAHDRSDSWSSKDALLPESPAAQSNCASPQAICTPDKHQDIAISSTLQRAHSLSQSIDKTVSTLQETVAELQRSASCTTSVPHEALLKLQAENEVMRQRLERLERSAWNQPCTTCIRMARSGALPTERSLVKLGAPKPEELSTAPTYRACGGNASTRWPRPMKAEPLTAPLGGHQFCPTRHTVPASRSPMVVCPKAIPMKSVCSTTASKMLPAQRSRPQIVQVMPCPLSSKASKGVCPPLCGDAT
ncbi:unnamed protein product [Effrenium voratum]|nr:unnamed protein product [Effrenium voratum]